MGISRDLPKLQPEKAIGSEWVKGRPFVAYLTQKETAADRITVRLISKNKCWLDEHTLWHFCFRKKSFDDQIGYMTNGREMLTL